MRVSQANCKISRQQNSPADGGRRGYHLGLSLAARSSSAVTQFQSPVDIVALRAALPALNAVSRQGSLFRSFPWFENLHAHGLESVRKLDALLLPAGDKGCLPLLDDGDCVRGLANYYSSLYGPIGALPLELAACLKDKKRATVDLHPLDPCAPEFQQLKQALSEIGYWVDDYFCFGNWYLDVNGRSYADYLAERPSQLRNNLQRGQGKLNKAGAWRIAIQKDNDVELDASIAAFESVYAKSWKQAEPQADFISGLCRTAAREGWLRLGVLYLDNAPLAAQLWLTHGGVASIYKLAYDEEAAHYSAGTVLTAAMFEQALDVDRVAEVDYLNGDEPYKQDWMSHRRERRGIVGFDLTQWGGLKNAMRHWAGCGLRKLRAERPQ
jgi:hypothetical protein